MSALLKHQQLIGQAGSLSVRGLVAQLELSDASGTTAADSGPNGYNGTYFQSCILNQASILPGGSKNSTLFSSASPNYGYVQLPNGLAAALGSTFSVILFVRFTSFTTPAGTATQLVCSPSGGVNFYLIGGKLIVGVAGVSNNALDTRSLSLNTNYMLGFSVAPNGDVKIYVNKVPSAVFAASLVGKSFSNGLRLFDYSSDAVGNYRLNGSAQRVIFCNVALSDAEFAAVYDGS